MNVAILIPITASVPLGIVFLILLLVKGVSKVADQFSPPPAPPAHLEKRAREIYSNYPTPATYEEYEALWVQAWREAEEEWNKGRLMVKADKNLSTCQRIRI